MTDARLQRLLGGEALAGLRKRLRQRFERGASIEVLRLGALSEAEYAALAALTGRPARHVRSMRIDVAAIDAALARAGLATTLRDALEQLDGPIIDGAAQRLRARSHWEQVVEGCEHAGLRAALHTALGLGLLKRLAASRPETGARLVRDADQVLGRLPAAAIPRAQLAVAALGDAHALDAGTPVATLVLMALRQGIPADDEGERARDVWAADGMPAAAQRVLLTQLRDAGATLHYHGDFDWPGLRIGNQLVREHAARPWRFSATDYRAALVGAPRPGRPLDDAAVSALWDDALAAAMLAERLAIDEEGIADVLLGDLRLRRCNGSAQPRPGSSELRGNTWRSTTGHAINRCQSSSSAMLQGLA